MPGTEDTNQTTTPPLGGAAPTTPNVETTFTKDQNLSINQPSPVVPPVSPGQPLHPPVVPAPAKPDSTAGQSVKVDFTPPTATPPSSTPPPVVPDAPLEPIVINEQDVKAAQSPAAPIKEPAVMPVSLPKDDQVETLHGQIGELNTSKVDLEKKPNPMTSQPSAASPIVEPPKPIEAPKSALPEPVKPPVSLMPTEKTPAPLLNSLPSTDEKSPFPTPSSPNPDPSKPPPTPLNSSPDAEKSAVATFSDIFAKGDKTPKAAAATPPTKDPTKADDTVIEGGSAPGVIGETLAIFGIVALVLALLTPLYRGLVSANLVTTVTAIAWLVAPITLVTGFLFLLFAKGKGLLKTLLLILIVISVVFYWGLKGSGGFADAISSGLGGLLNSYR